MSLGESLSRIRHGFHPTFWVANGMELFERLAYYGQGTVLSIFLRDHLKFSELETGQLSSIFGGLIYLLPIIGGTLADKFGFRRAFSVAFFMLAIGYFLIGSTGMAQTSAAFEGLPLFWIMVVILVFTAIGGSFIKPSVLGTVAVTSRPDTKSLGYAFYYWIVNIGAALGPLVAYQVREHIGIAYVYVVSAASCALMLLVNLLFYREVKDEAHEVAESLATKMKNLVVVLRNGRFMAFLLIYSLYWIIFWQFFVIVPFYVTDAVSAQAPFELILSTGAWAIIVLQLPINWLTKSLRTRSAILVGFIISGLSWLVISFAPSLPHSLRPVTVLAMTLEVNFNPALWAVIGGILTFSIGEMIQAPRYYEYISGIAPKGQQGLFQGYAFLPIAIAWFVGGTLGGWLYERFAKEAGSPRTMFLVMFGIGVVAMVLMAVYTAVTSRSAKAEGASS